MNIICRISKYTDKMIKKLRWFDLSLIKLSVAAIILTIAKLWPPILSLEWHSYLMIALIASIRPLMIYFGLLK